MLIISCVFTVYLLGSINDPIIISDRKGNFVNYILGNSSDLHYSFGDPFIMLLYPSEDRIWTNWQTTLCKDWLHVPDFIYDDDSNSNALRTIFHHW